MRVRSFNAPNNTCNALRRVPVARCGCSYFFENVLSDVRIDGRERIVQQNDFLVAIGGTRNRNALFLTACTTVHR